MAQTHHLPQSLPPGCGTGTLAHWSIAPATHLVVFVHGFKGGPIDTWPDFPTLLAANTALPPFDYIFYGYDGVRRQANSSALEFADFLDSFLTDPAVTVNASIPRDYARAAFTYQRVVLVAHSLGAVITRNALLQAYRRRKHGPAPVSWLDRVRMVLFAPAHHGAYAAEIASAALTDHDWYLGKLIGAIARFRLPLLDDLQQGSALINALHTETKQVIDEYIKQGLPVPEFISAHGVLWALDEYVVHNIHFFADAPEQTLQTDHRGVCKPRDATHRALQLVWGAL